MSPLRAIALVGPPHDASLAQVVFGHLLGDAWDVIGYPAQSAVPDDVAGETEFLVAAAGVRVDGSLLTRAPKLRLIQVPGHGFEHIDLAAARAAGVPVATIVSSGAEAHTVAEWVILTAGAASRRLVEGHVALAGGAFANATLMQSGVFELAGKTMGIVGLGRIGREVATRARAFAMPLIYSDAVRASADVEESLGIAFRTFDELLAQADVITLHVPSLPSTRGLIDARAFELMKHSAILVNTSRGPVVDHDALVAALSAKRIRAAAIDVYDPEPPVPGDPLLTLDNVMLSPHMAGVTAESLLRILQAASANCNRVARGEEPLDVVEEGAAH